MKKKLGFYWAASCGGCDIAVLEIHEKLIELLDQFEIVFWPCVMDVKYSDVERMADQAIDVCLFNGAIRHEENADMARLLRRKSKVLVAYGACAMTGGIPGLANLYPPRDLLTRLYVTTESTDNADEVLPQVRTRISDGQELYLPGILPRVKSLHQVVPVDYYMPGCPPSDKQTWAVCQAIAKGELPPPGSIIGAGDKSVCDECSRSKGQNKMTEIRRRSLHAPDDATCLLEQGVICMGPATRSGCEAQCLRVSVPCQGCYGPAGDGDDMGARMIGALASLVAEDEQSISTVVSQFLDPAGTMYRFTLPTSILGEASANLDASPDDSGAEESRP